MNEVIITDEKSKPDIELIHTFSPILIEHNKNPEHLMEKVVSTNY